MKEEKNEAEEAERLLKRRASKRRYWQKFKQTRKRIYGSLSQAEYRDLEARAKAHKHSVWDQVWLESQAYRQQEYLPTPLIERELAALIQIVRGMAGNINQMARYSHWVRRAYNQNQVIKRLGDLEQVVRGFVKNPVFTRGPNHEK